MKKFRTLELAETFYHYTETLGLNGNLRDQLSRAASSIPLNLAEGNAKPSAKEKLRYYQTAYASLKECQSILRLAKIENKDVNQQADFLGACLYKLTKANLTSALTQSN
jgi:four helix bundle protein